jgi:PIN like domain
MSSASRPEFFLDRSLGKETAKRLRQASWTVHLLAEVYRDDAQDVADEDWIAEGARRDWILLTKDKRIRYRGSELAAVHDGRLFCLANGNLSISEMVRWFRDAEPRILRACATHSSGFWKIYSSGRIDRSWPG